MLLLCSLVWTLCGFLPFYTSLFYAWWDCGEDLSSVKEPENILPLSAEHCSTTDKVIGIVQSLNCYRMQRPSCKQVTHAMELIPESNSRSYKDSLLRMYLPSGLRFCVANQQGIQLPRPGFALTVCVLLVLLQGWQFRRELNYSQGTPIPWNCKMLAGSRWRFEQFGFPARLWSPPRNWRPSVGSINSREFSPPQECNGTFHSPPDPHAGCWIGPSLF